MINPVLCFPVVRQAACAAVTQGFSPMMREGKVGILVLCTVYHCMNISVDKTDNDYLLRLIG